MKNGREPGRSVYRRLEASTGGGDGLGAEGERGLGRAVHILDRDLFPLGVPTSTA